MDLVRESFRAARSAGRRARSRKCDPAQPTTIRMSKGGRERVREKRRERWRCGWDFGQGKGGGRQLLQLNPKKLQVPESIRYGGAKSRKEGGKERGDGGIQKVASGYADAGWKEGGEGRNKTTRACGSTRRQEATSCRRRCIVYFCSGAAQCLAATRIRKHHMHAMHLSLFFCKINYNDMATTTWTLATLGLVPLTRRHQESVVGPRHTHTH